LRLEQRVARCRSLGDKAKVSDRFFKIAALLKMYCKFGGDLMQAVNERRLQPFTHQPVKPDTTSWRQATVEDVSVEDVCEFVVRAHETRFSFAKIRKTNEKISPCKLIATVFHDRTCGSVAREKRGDEICTNHTCQLENFLLFAR